MEDDWEKLADVDDVELPKEPKISNKWDGEDSDDDIKDNWEDEDEEKKDDEKTEVKVKPKKSLEQKIKEKERQTQMMLEKKRMEKEEDEAYKNMTPEQKLAEKLRLQRLQEESDLKLALGTLGIVDKSGIDGMNPKTKEEFSEFAEAISKKVIEYRNDDEFSGFAEELIRNICASLPSTSIRKIKNSVDNIYLEKQKLEKGDKPKKGKAGKKGIKLRVEGQNTNLEEDFDGYNNEYDDFM